MNTNSLEYVLEQFKKGEISSAQIADKIKSFGVEDLGYVNIDHHRSIRQGTPEVIYGEGKTAAQIAEIMLKLSQKNETVISTRTSKQKFDEIVKIVPNAKYFEQARIVALYDEQKFAEIQKQDKYIAICTAGTSDIPVAEEACITAQLLGNRVERIYDVGVAGIHRLFAKLDMLQKANVIIAIAGMEGALVSVIGGLVDKPVVAVPTSVGYGASYEGVTALLTMMNSCASGVGVVNIDNGFGAGFLASRINNMNI